MESGEGFIMRTFKVHTVHLNIIRMIKSKLMWWTNHVNKSEECRNASEIVTAIPTGKKYLGKCKHRWEYNVRIKG